MLLMACGVCWQQPSWLQCKLPCNTRCGTHWCCSWLGDCPGSSEPGNIQNCVALQDVQALVLVGVGGLATWTRRGAGHSFFVTGIFGFSGSLYILVFTELRPGLMTPLGGLLLMAGWLTLLLAGLVRKRANPH